MRSTRRAAATILVVAITAFAAACAPMYAPDPATVGANGAANWLVTQFDATTHLIPSAFVPGSPDPGASAYAATSLKITGVGGTTASAAVAALAPIVDLYVKDSGGNDKPGSLSRLILAIESIGGNPRAFGGFDLVARLEATIRTTGPDVGLFGVQSPTYDGAFRQGLALSALSLVSPKPASIDPGAGSIASLPAVAWLFSQQCADGSWMPYRANLATPCAFDPITYSSPDTNSTALAVLGVHAVGGTSPVDPATWLNAIRNPDGGWSFDGSVGSPSDPDSTGLVIGARRALGTFPDAAAISALLAFQLGASAPAPDQGAFFYPYGPPTPNLLATNDAILGLANGVWPQVLNT